MSYLVDKKLKQIISRCFYKNTPISIYCHRTDILHGSTLAAVPIIRRISRAIHTLKVHNHIIPENLSIRIQIKVIPESIIIGTARVRAPLSIAIIRAQVRDHDDNGLACRTAGALSGRAVAGGGELEALAAAGAAPGGAGFVVDCLGGGGGVDAWGDAELPAKGAGVVTAAAGTFLAVKVALKATSVTVMGT